MGGDLFHLVPKDTWEEHKATQSPYYPSTYEQVPLALLNRCCHQCRGTDILSIIYEGPYVLTYLKRYLLV